MRLIQYSSFFRHIPMKKTISGTLFRTLRRTQYDQRFTRNTITINQLKNAGGHAADQE